MDCSRWIEIPLDSPLSVPKKALGKHMEDSYSDGQLTKMRLGSGLVIPNVLTSLKLEGEQFHVISWKAVPADYPWLVCYPKV